MYRTHECMFDSWAWVQMQYVLYGVEKIPMETENVGALTPHGLVWENIIYRMRRVIHFFIFE